MFTRSMSLTMFPLDPCGPSTPAMPCRNQLWKIRSEQSASDPQDYKLKITYRLSGVQEGLLGPSRPRGPWDKKKWEGFWLKRASILFWILIEIMICCWVTLPPGGKLGNKTLTKKIKIQGGTHITLSPASPLGSNLPSSPCKGGSSEEEYGYSNSWKQWMIRKAFFFYRWIQKSTYPGSVLSGSSMGNQKDRSHPVRKGLYYIQLNI